jgi:hypothetical protein
MLGAWLRIFHVSPRVEILGRLEEESSGKNAAFGHLALLPARYAFLWSGGSEAIQCLTR